MKNLKWISMAVIMLMAFSCNSDDDSVGGNVEENGFFSEDVLKVGNKWVYKTYENYGVFDNPFEFNGAVIHREVVGEVMKNGIQFSVMSIRYFDNGVETDYPATWYVRINQKGHFISISEENFESQVIDENYGYVFHPGNDSEYVFTASHSYGITKEYRISPSISLAIEGNNYETIPYMATFVVNPELEDNYDTFEAYYFHKDVGFIMAKYYNGYDYGYEDRLVSFTPGD